MSGRILLLLAMLVSTCAGIFAPTSGAAAQGESGLQGNTYADPVYGFFVEWDGDLFDAEEMIGDDGVAFGVYLIGEYITASIAAGGYSDVEECLEDRVERLDAIDGVSNLRESRRVDPLEFDREVLGAVYQYRYLNPDTGDSDTFATYFGCEPLLVDGEVQADVILTQDFGTPLDMFIDLSPPWVELINGLEFAGGNRASTNQEDDTGTDTGGVSGNQYFDPNDGWAVEWDDAFLTGENWESEEPGEIQGVQLSTESGNFMTIFTEENRSERACVNNQVDSLEGSSFTDFEEVETVELPETHEDARVAIFEGIFTSSDGVEVPIYFYVECRVLIVDGEEVEDRFLVVNLLAETGSYEDEVPVWSDVLTSLETDAGGGSDGPVPDDDDPRPDDLGESGIDGDTYTSNIGYRITWDDAVFTGELLDAENPDAGLNLSSEASFMTFQVVSDPSVEACVEAEASTVESLGGMGRLSTSREDPPDSPRGAASEIYDGVLTFDDGSEADVIVYVECRPMGDDSPLFLVIRMVTFSDAYQDELPLWQELLDGIEIVGLDL